MTMSLVNVENVGNNLPDNYWGHGKADAYAALVGCVIGMNEYNPAAHVMSIFPNPASDKVTVYYSLQVKDATRASQFVIADVLGKTIVQIPLKESEGMVEIPVQHYSPGIYFCMMTSGKTLLNAQKLVVK